METKSNHYTAIATISFSVFIFVISDSIVKYLNSSFSSFEIVFFRSLFGMIPLTLSLAISPHRSKLSIPRPWSLLTCSLVGAFAVLLIVKGLGLIPLANFYAIQFSGPLIMTALAVPLLGEHIKPYRAFLIFIGFLAVLFIVKPTSFSDLTLGSALSFLGIGLLSFFLVQIRKLSRMMSTLTIVFYTTLAQGLLMGILMINSWTTPTLYELAVLATMGVLGTIAQMINAKGYSMAPIQMTAPFEYTNIIWGVLLGYFFWNEIPGLNVGLGASLLLLCGILLVYDTRNDPNPALTPQPSAG